MTEHIYIKLSREEWNEQHHRFLSVLEDGAYLCEVPNSIPSHPYKPHPQFTIRILGNKITVWSDVNDVAVCDEGGKDDKNQR